MRSGFALSPPALFAPFSQTAVSEEAAVLRQHWQALFETILSSIVMGDQYRQLQVALAALARDAACGNWDGHGASPVNDAALAYAGRVAQMLPVTIPAPEVSVDPDGEVSFDWYASPRRSLSVSIDPVGTLRYASIVGGSENFGLEPWRDGLPESVLRLLQKVATREATN